MSIQDKLKNNVFFIINKLVGRVAKLEYKLYKLESEMTRQMAIQRNHLVRVKNQGFLPDDFIQNGRAYLDLSPEKAWAMYKDPNQDFIFIDVSYKNFELDSPRPKECLHIPLEEIDERFGEIPNHSTPIIIISEDGLRSILACEFLNSKGYFNCNNVSGGWKFWLGHRLVEVKNKATA